MEEGVTFTEVGENNFIMEFKKTTDKEKILLGRPWTFDRNLIAIQDVDSNLPPNDVRFSHEPFWVQLHNVPFAGMTKAYGNQIASTIGKVIKVKVDKEG